MISNRFLTLASHIRTDDSTGIYIEVIDKHRYRYMFTCVIVNYLLNLHRIILYYESLLYKRSMNLKIDFSKLQLEISSLLGLRSRAKENSRII